MENAIFTPRRGAVFAVAVVAMLMILVSAAMACVPQRGDLDVSVPFGQSAATITGDGGSIPLEWCVNPGAGDEAEAAEGDEITVTVSAATQHGSCPGTTNDRLPEGNHQVWVSNHTSDWGWEFERNNPGEWDLAKKGQDPEDYGCFVSDPSRTHDQGTTVAVDANGNGTATFNLDLSAAAVPAGGPDWVAAPNDAGWAAVLCVGNPDAENTVGIFQPLHVTAVNTTL